MVNIPGIPPSVNVPPGHKVEGFATRQETEQAREPSEEPPKNAKEKDPFLPIQRDPLGIYRDTYIEIKIRDEEGTTFLGLYQGTTDSGDGRIFPYLKNSLAQVSEETFSRRLVWQEDGPPITIGDITTTKVYILPKTREDLDTLVNLRS